MQEQDKRNKGVRTKKKGDNWNSRNNKRDNIISEIILDRNKERFINNVYLVPVKIRYTWRSR